MYVDQAINLFIIGITLGSVYAVMALGLSFIYGITKIFNYAQGAFFTWGAYIAWMLSEKYLELPYAIAGIITVAVMYLFGLGYEKVCMYPLRRFPRWDMTAIIVTLGSALLLDNLALVLFGGRAKRLPYLADGNFTLHNIVITNHELITLVVALIVVVLLVFFFEKVKTGMAMQAVAQDGIGARMVGIPINKIFSHAFAMSASLAGISAILLAPKVLVYPTVGWLVFVKAFVIMVFGGVGSIKGTAIAAFILAMVEAFVTFYLGATWGMPIFILVLIIMFTFKPKGLFGTW